jgi:pimeloyl-ACP methyl ester carboxylesterase
VPGGSFEALLGLFGLPRKVRPPLGRLGAQLVRIVGPVGSVLVGSLPPLPALVSPPALRGPVLEAMHPGVLYQVLREVARNDWNWFHDLLLGIAEHPVMDTSFVRFPVTVLLGRFDAVVSPQDARAAAERIPGVRVREFLSGTHYLPLQYPQVILEELRQLHQLAFKAPPPS